MNSEILRRAKLSYLGHPNVIGVGRGVPGIVLFVKEKPHSELRTFRGVPVQTIVSGEINALQLRTDKWRPAPGGVSIGHYGITAGTLGCVVRDTETGARMILSNNHVLAACNLGIIGDAIHQPGPYDQDGGDDDDDDSTCPFSLLAISIFNLFSWLLRNKTRLRAIVPRQEDFTIATLAKFVPIEFSQSAANLVDCALAKPLNDADVLDEILEIGTPVGWIDDKDIQIGMPLIKSGRTTGLTEGTITSLETTVDVGYGGDTVARFENQIVTTSMCAGGDSGSLVLQKDTKLAVGLLFAGSDTTAVHNPIREVINALNIKFA